MKDVKKCDKCNGVLYAITTQSWKKSKAKLKRSDEKKWHTYQNYKGCIECDLIYHMGGKTKL